MGTRPVRRVPGRPDPRGRQRPRRTARAPLPDPEHTSGAASVNPRRADLAFPLRQRRNLRGAPQHPEFLLSDARGARARVRLRLVRHQPRRLRFTLPGRQVSPGPPRARRTLHERDEHSQDAWPALPRRPAGTLRRTHARSHQAQGAPSGAPRPTDHGSRLRLRQLPGRRLPGTAGPRHGYPQTYPRTGARPQE